MRKRTLATLVIAFTLAHQETRAETVRQTYRFSGSAAQFLYDRDRHLVLSVEHCPPLGESYDCMAYRALSRVEFKSLHVPAGGADPGALACVQQAHGRLVVGRNPLGHEATFCVFNDGSMVSAGSLDYYSRASTR